VVGLVASLVLTTKASDDPTYDGQAAVRGYPKVPAGSGRQKPISETPLMSSEADSEKHTMPPVMTEDNAMMLSDEIIGFETSFFSHEISSLGVSRILGADNKGKR